MPGLVPGIHDSLLRNTKDVDGRDKPGHDGKRLTRSDGDCRSGPFQPARGWKGGGRADRAELVAVTCQPVPHRPVHAN